MADIKELQASIDEARELLINIIKGKQVLLDPEILYISKLLDYLLNEYYRLSKSVKE